MATEQATRPRPFATAATGSLQDERLSPWQPSETLPIPVSEGLLQRGPGTRARYYAAITAWTAGIFGLIYVVGPLAMAAVGWTAAIGSLFNNALAFAVTVPAILLLLEWARPTVHLDRSKDPVLAVALGSMASWAWLHNTVGILRPFRDFATGELAAFVVLNGVEFTLFAAVFAMLVRSRLGGFVLGFAFQLAYIAVFVLGTTLI